MNNLVQSYQTLVESGEYELLSEDSGLCFRLNEDFVPDQRVRSEIDRTGLLLVRGIPATVLDTQNANGRIYAREMMEGALKEAKKFFESRSLLCTGDDHPDSAFVRPITASHIVVDCYIKDVKGKSIMFNDWVVLNTRNGQDLKAVIEAGSTIGTSIRGLGRQNEETSQIEKYKYLGTDAVGQPSAGTFAGFEPMKVTLESVDDKILTGITESLKGNDMKFKLDEAIQEFKNKHQVDGKFPETPKMETVRDYVDLERTAVKEGVEDLAPIDQLRLEAFGSEPTDEPDDSSDDVNESHAESARTRDLLNKAERRASASETIAKHLQTENEALLATQEQLQKFRSTAEDLAHTFADRAAKLTQDLEESRTSGKVTDNIAIDQFRERAVRMVSDLQVEARAVIDTLEERLETAIHAGDEIATHFEAVKVVANALRARLEEVTSQNEVKDKTVKETVHRSTLGLVTESSRKRSGTDRSDRTDKRGGGRPGGWI